MELHDLKPAVGSNKKKTRIGRGPGSGKGGTSTRGHKGAKSRSGYKQKVGFEGGQMPLQRRVPKGGFKNINRVEYKAINVAVLEALAEKNNLEKTISKRLPLPTLSRLVWYVRTNLLKFWARASSTTRSRLKPMLSLRRPRRLSPLPVAQS